MKLTSVSQEIQGIPGIPAWEPGEERDYPAEFAEVLLRNANIVAVEPPKKDSSKKDSSQSKDNE